MFLIPRKWWLEQLSCISSDFLVFNSLCYHVHLTEFRVSKKNGNTEFSINEFNFDVSGQWLLSFDEFVLLGLTVFWHLINLLFSFSILFLLDFGLFLELRFCFDPQLFELWFLPIRKQIKCFLKPFDCNKGLSTSIVCLGIVWIILETNLTINDDFTIVFVFQVD